MDEPEQVASVLENLIRSNNILMAYQLGFDLYESATQQFLHKVKNLLKALVNIPQPMETDSSSKPISSDDVKIEESSTTSVRIMCPVASPSQLYLLNDFIYKLFIKGGGGEFGDVTGKNITTLLLFIPLKVNDNIKNYIEKLLTILNGEITINVNMQFLIKNNHSDLLVVKAIKVFFCFFSL